MLLLAGLLGRHSLVGIGRLLGRRLVDLHRHRAGIELAVHLPGLDLLSGHGLDLPEDLQQLHLGPLEVLRAVEVLHVGHRQVEAVVGTEVFKVVVEGQLVLDVLAEHDGRLVSPAPGDVAEGVSTAAEDEGGDVEAADELDAVGVAADAEVEAPEAVAGQGVGPALQHDGAGGEPLHDLADDGPEDGAEGVVVHAVVEGEVDGVVLAVGVAHVEDVAGAREVLAELVEADGHDAVGRVEGLLDAVAVVDVDVDVEDALVLLEELEDGQNAVVDVAEARRLGLLGVMEAAGPVDDDVGAVLVEAAGAADGAGSVQLAELEEAVENGAVLPDVEALELADVVLHVVGGDDAEEVDVVVGVEARHGRRADEAGPEDLHPPVQAVVHDEVVRHADAVGLHGVALAVVVVADLGIVEVGDAAGVLGGHDVCVVMWIYMVCVYVFLGETTLGTRGTNK